VFLSCLNISQEEDNLRQIVVWCGERPGEDNNVNINSRVELFTTTSDDDEFNNDSDSSEQQSLDLISRKPHAHANRRQQRSETSIFDLKSRVKYTVLADLSEEDEDDETDENDRRSGEDVEENDHKTDHKTEEQKQRVNGDSNTVASLPAISKQTKKQKNKTQQKQGNNKSTPVSIQEDIDVDDLLLNEALTKSELPLVMHDHNDATRHEVCYNGVALV